MKFKISFTMMMILAILAGSLSAQKIPQVIFYQGYLTDNNGEPLNQNQSMTFRIYTALTGGEKRWEEVNSSIPVNQGVFSILLGSQNPIPMDIFSDKTRFLEISIGNETLSPRQQIASVPYAYTAGSVQGSANVFPTQGNVGIGTTNPQSALDVRGKQFSIGTAMYSDGNSPSGKSIVGTDGVNTDLAAATDDKGSVRILDGNGDGALAISNWENSRLDSYKNKKTKESSDLILQNDGGNVGIGLDNPTAKLQVKGSIHSTEGGFKFPDGSTQTTAAKGGGTGGGTLDQAYDYGGPGIGRKIVADAGPVQIDGNSGLTVKPNVTITGGGQEGGQISLVDGDNQGGWEIDNAGTSGKESIRFFRDGTQNQLLDAFTIKSNGNVGIGIGDPQHKLAVNGVGYFRGLRFPNSVEPNSVGLQGENYLSFGHAGVSADFIDYHHNTFYFVDSPGGENEPPNVNISGDLHVSGQVLVVGDDGLKLGATGVSILQIIQVTGMTASSGDLTKIHYPSGFNMDNTRVISLEIKISAFWLGLGAFNDAIDGVSIHYSLNENYIGIDHENDDWYHNKPIRMLLMRIK